MHVSSKPIGRLPCHRHAGGVAGTGIGFRIIDYSDIGIIAIIPEAVLFRIVAGQ